MQSSTQNIFTAACWYKLLLLTIKSLGFISVKAGNVPKLFTEPLVSNRYACLRHFLRPGSSYAGGTNAEIEIITSVALDIRKAALS